MTQALQPPQELDAVTFRYAFALAQEAQRHIIRFHQMAVPRLVGVGGGMFVQEKPPMDATTERMDRVSKLYMEGVKCLALFDITSANVLFRQCTVEMFRRDA